MGTTIIGKLKGIQVREGFIDAKMAQLLGCSRQLYQMTRSGKIPLGLKIPKGISVAFPELKEEAQNFLSNDAQKLPRDANKNPLKSTSGAQGRGIKRFFVELLGRIKR